MLNDRMQVKLPMAQLGFIQFVVAPLVVVSVHIFKNWVLIAKTLARNTEEWANLHFQDTGDDVSSRVDAVRSLLADAVVSGNDAEGLDELEDDELTSEDQELEQREYSRQSRASRASKASRSSSKLSLSSELALPSISEAKKALDPGKRHSVVRELRRWRESSKNPELDQHRELVLLLHLADDSAHANKQEVIMKLHSSNHFREPEGPTCMQVSDAQAQALVPYHDPTPDAPAVLNVAVAPDTMRSQLDRKRFDGLLSSLLGESLEVIASKP